MPKNFPILPTPIEPEIPFTAAAYHQLQLDVDRLTAERKEVMIRLQTAREMGDLSENGAYIYAKFELGSISRQLAQLNHLLKNGVVVEKSNLDIVDFGCTVTLEQRGKFTSYTLVSIHESNLEQHKLSTESPIGKALLGKKVGDQVVISVPNGEITYTVTKIE